MIRFLLAVLAFSLSFPAFAQDDDFERKRDRFMEPDSQLGTRFKQSPETASETDARQMQKRLARCVFYGNEEEIAELLANSDFDRIDFDATAFTSDEFFDDIDFGRCLGRSMKQSQYKILARIQYSTLRNLLAEEAYLYESKNSPVREDGAPTLIEDRFAYVKGSPRAAVLAKVSDCITFRNGPAAHVLLGEVPRSKGEGEALEALWPALLTCLEAEEPPELSTSMVRQMIADGMWARSHYSAWSKGPVEETVAE